MADVALHGSCEQADGAPGADTPGRMGRQGLAEEENGEEEGETEGSRGRISYRECCPAASDRPRAGRSVRAPYFR
ncbi:hypothetical protein Acsp04_14210 [Actinomadura sp. NBRC 104425]|nr:hypothetical protein Acsp04_14210 [Actinomadura sp. NBRC 104425]